VQHTAAEPVRPKRIVKEYDYLDESGQLVYQVVRYEPKGFAQRKEVAGKWVWKLDEPDKGITVRRVLYHLDRVIESEGTVYVVEGEKDVEALEVLGLVATCNPQGAGKWAAVMDCASRALAGRRVVVIADADERGRKHAADVKARLTGVVASVRVLELPGGKDSADWVAGGGTAEALAALADAPEAPVPEVGASVDPSKDFARDEDGKIYHSQVNIRLALAKLGVQLKHDMFAHHNVVEGMADAGPKLDQTAKNRLRLAVDEKWGFRLSKELWADVVANEAWSNRFHPVRDYFSSLAWDGGKRIGGGNTPSWLTTYGGATDSPYTRAVGRLWLVAAVRRVRQPGCKFDEMLILESPPGKDKSQMFGILAIRPEWLCDDLPINGDTKELMEQTNGALIVVCEELKGFGKAGHDKLKSYVSRTRDSSRLAYREDSESTPRQFVLAGTTNCDSGYFRDITGNRKYWPVSITQFDLPAMRRDVDQLWAEAVAAETAGESIRLDKSLYAAAAEQQEARMIGDSMEEMISDCFGDLEGKVKVSDAWRVTGIYPNRPLDQKELERFGAAMRRCGFLPPKQIMVNGERKSYYTRGNSPQILRVAGSGGGATCTVV
jgi:hypothetical protein